MRAMTVLPKPNPTPQQQNPDSSVERRAWVRSACDLEAACHAPSLGLETLWPARVENLSPGGAGLVLSRRFEPEALLEVELPLAHGGFRRSLHAEVVHVAEHPRGGWLHGIVFADPLAAEELSAVLGYRPDF